MAEWIAFPLHVPVVVGSPPTSGVEDLFPGLLPDEFGCLVLSLGHSVFRETVESIDAK